MALSFSRALIISGSFALALSACGDDDSNGGAPPSVVGGAGGKGGASGAAAGSGATAGKGGTAGANGTAGKSGASGTAGAAGKSGQAGASGAAGAAGSTTGGAAGSGGAAGTSGGSAGAATGGSAGATTGGSAGTNGGSAGASTGGSAGTTAGGSAGTAAGAAGSSGGAGGEAGAAGEPGAGGVAGSAGAAGAAGGGGAGGDACATVTVLDSVALFGTFYDISSRLTNLAGPAVDLATIRFASAPTKTTYTLTKPTNGTQAPQLVALGVDVDPSTGQPATLYVAVEGTVAVSDIVTKSQTKGTLAGIELREATVGSDDSISFVDGGKCLRVASAAWDTTLSCSDGKHCGVNSACDPDTRQCVTQCAGGSPVACASTETCLQQAASGGGIVGACYAKCEVSVGSTCANGAQTCALANLDGSGFCRGVEQLVAPEGGRCGDGTETTSRCEAGTVCVADDLIDPAVGVCRKVCKPLAGGCPASQVCGIFGACLASGRLFETQAVEDSACTVGKTQCLIEGGAAKGACVNGGCERIVFGQGQCPVGTSFIPFQQGGGGFCD